MSLYCHLIIYLFLPIAKKTVALITGTLVSLICLVIFIVVELKFVSKKHTSKQGCVAVKNLSEVVR